MKRLTFIFFVLAALIYATTACASPIDMKILDFNISRVVPSGLTSVDGTINFNIDNRGEALEVSAVTGSIFKDGVKVCDFTTCAFTIPKKSSGWIPLSGTISLDPNVSTRFLMSMLMDMNLSKYSVSYSGTVKVGAFKRNVSGENVPVTNFMRK